MLIRVRDARMTVGVKRRFQFGLSIKIKVCRGRNLTVSRPNLNLDWNFNLVLLLASHQCCEENKEKQVFIILNFNFLFKLI